MLLDFVDPAFETGPSLLTATSGESPSKCTILHSKKATSRESQCFPRSLRTLLTFEYDCCFDGILTKLRVRLRPTEMQ